jgi:hypothetical protein
MVRFILSGNYEQPPTMGPEPVEGTCVFCGETALEARLSRQFFQIDCTACERQLLGQPTTPAQARSRSFEDLVDSVRQTSARDYRQIRQGTCPECSGTLDAEIVDFSESPLPDGSALLVTSECRQCLREYNCPLTYSVAYHPASVAFHWDRGVDVLRTGIWEFNEAVYEGRWTSERVSAGAGEYRVVFRHGDDSLRVYLDSTATVTRTERVRRDDGGRATS